MEQYKVYMEPSGKRLEKNIYDILQCSQLSTVRELIDKYGYRDFIDKVCQAGCIVLEMPGKPAKFYKFPIRKPHVETKLNYTMDKFIKFVEKRAQERVQYLTRKHFPITVKG